MLPLQNRLSLEKSIYKSKINVALYHAEEAVKFEKFNREIYRALNKQVARIAKNPQAMDMLTLLAKGAIDLDLVIEIGKYLYEDHMDKMVNIAAYLYWAASLGGQAALDKLNIEGIFVLENTQVTQYFDDYANLLANKLDDTTKKWIAQTIQDGKKKFLTPNEIAQTLIDDGKEINKMRALRIAVTETAKAMTTVEIEAAKRYGIREKIWRTSIYDVDKAICEPLEGVKVNINQSFPGGYQGPPAHPNCRCFIEEVVPDGWIEPEKPWLGQ